MSLTFAAWRFALTGVIVTLVHIAVAVALIERLQFHPGAANGLAFVVANGLSYAINTRWSFQSRLSLNTWWRFILVSVVAWALTVALAWLVERAGGHYLVGIGLVVGLVPALSFAAHRFFTYPPSTRNTGLP